MPWISTLQTQTVRRKGSGSRRISPRSAASLVGSHLSPLPVPSQDISPATSPQPPSVLTEIISCRCPSLGWRGFLSPGVCWLSLAAVPRITEDAFTVHWADARPSQPGLPIITAHRPQPPCCPRNPVGPVALSSGLAPRQLHPHCLPFTFLLHQAFLCPVGLFFLFVLRTGSHNVV